MRKVLFKTASCSGDCIGAPAREVSDGVTWGTGTPIEERKNTAKARKKKTFIPEKKERKKMLAIRGTKKRAKKRTKDKR